MSGKIVFSSARALEIGKAAEHIVCADIMLSGYSCYLSDQGLPYDLVLDQEGRLLRVQVKSTCLPKNINMRGRNERIGYTFHVRKRGKNSKGERLNSSMCDLVAMVALDIMVIAYLPISEVGQTCQFMPPNFEFRGHYKRTRGVAIDKFPLSSAVDRVGGGDV